MAACRSNEFAVGGGGGSLFTDYLVEALMGGAADVLGTVTLATSYAFILQRLSAWDQNPMFKCNLSKFSSIRTCRQSIQTEQLQSIQTEQLQSIQPEQLRRLTDHFPDPKKEHMLDPGYEEDKRDVPVNIRRRNKKKEKIFADFRKFASLGLLVSVGEEYLYWAAVRSKSCRLTSLGQHYWHLVDKGKI